MLKFICLFNNFKSSRNNNYKLDHKVAFTLNKIFLEVIIANGFEPSALKLLKLKKNLRIIDSTNYKTNEIFQVNSETILKYFLP